MENSRLVRIRRGQKKQEGEPEEEEFPDLPENERCWVCKKRPIAYQPLDCDCAVYCRVCAMKLATGFCCKKCKQMSSGMRRIRR